jgi:ribokinase
VTAGAAVAVVGSLNVDFVANVETLPRPGETVIGGTFERHWGGKGGNQAVAAARYGARVTFFGAVGNDDLGAAALAALNDEGIDTHPTMRVAEATGVALIMVDRNGQNQIAVASGANLRVRANNLREVLDTNAQRGVVLTCFEVPDEAVVEAHHAVAAGWTLVINPAPARPIDPRLRGCGAILTPNEGELRDLTGIDSVVGAARSLIANGPGGPVVVTLGERGAVLVTADAAVEVAAPEVTARDATGAGDIFNGVFAAALAQGQSLLDAVRTGVAAASYAVELPGARRQLQRSELEARLERQQADGRPALGRERRPRNRHEADAV